MPVTRSATRAAERSTRLNHTKADTTKAKSTDAKPTKPKTTKSKITKAKAAQPSTLSATSDAGESETSLKSRHGRLLEWLSLTDTADGVIPDSDRLFCLLQELRQQKGCQVVARGRPRELTNIEWLMIEWQDSAAREEFLASELFLELEKVLIYRLLERELVWPINCASYDQIIRAKPVSPPQKLYEVLTVYLPVDLDDATIASLERLIGLPQWPEEVNWELKGYRSQHPMVGFLSQRRGWIEGKVEYCGQPAQRLVYFFKFEDEEAEQYFKEELRWGRRIRKGREVWEVMEHFLEDLEKLGMIGFESRHVRFLEVVEHVPENACIPLGPSLPIIMPETADQEAYWKMLCGLDDETPDL